MIIVPALAIDSHAVRIASFRARKISIKMSESTKMLISS